MVTNMERLLIATTTVLSLVLGCNGLDTVVDTDIGRIEGFVDHVNISGQRKPLLKFYGIPYAEAPIGVHRFNKPIPKAPFTKTFHADTETPMCSQEGLSFPIATEDCLVLNIVIPGSVSNTSSLPVMVFIHAGGLARESASDYDYKSDALVSFGEVIVVNINYRLNVLGFLQSADGSLIGNQGLWDQHLALQWINKHIRYFHGNPNDVTLFGQSTGADCVLYHSVYAGNKGLFQRGIAKSGSFFFTTDTPNAEEIIGLAGCNKTSDLTTQIACLRATPAANLSALSNTIQFYASIDGEFFVEHPLDIINGHNPISNAARQHFASLDLMFGLNDLDGYEFLWDWNKILTGTEDPDDNYFNITLKRRNEVLVPLFVDRAFPYIKSNTTAKVLESVVANEYTDWNDPHNSDYLRRSVVDMTSDFMFFAPTLAVVNAHGKFKRGNTYLYMFALDSSHYLRLPYWLNGSVDGDEIAYFFGVPVSSLKQSWVKDYTRDEQTTSYFIMSTFTNFAKTGNPNGPADLMQYANISWPGYELASQRYLNLATPLSASSVQQRLLADKMALWLDLLPSLIKITDAKAHTHPIFNPSTGLVG